MSCGACSASLPAGARFCPQCGTRAGTAAVPGQGSTFADFAALERTGQQPTDLRCPRCAQLLTEVDYGAVALDECGGCGGIWFDERELDALLARLRARQEAAEGPALAQRLRRFAPEGKVTYLPCPRCDGRMARFNYGRISGVIVDRCGQHGLWLDRGEIDKIVAFLSSGGAVESERRAADAAREEARQARGEAERLRWERRLGGRRWIGPWLAWDVF